jgi:hypothetical protein
MNIIDTTGKLLIPDNCPQLRIGDKLYSVDNRRSTFKKIMAVQESAEIADKDEEILRLTFGQERAQEIIDMDLPFSEWQNLLFYVLSACTGEPFEKVKAQAEKN